MESQQLDATGHLSVRAHDAAPADGAAAAARQSRLAVAADAALRTTLGGDARRASRRERDVTGARLRPAVRALCEQAYRQGAHAEDVIIAVKRAWASMPELTAARDPGDQQRGADVLRRFISVCIDEFYATRPSPSDGRVA